MRALLHTEFAALLARADVSQAAFARLTGVTARQVNNWARGRAPVPAWAGLLAAIVQAQSPALLAIAAEATAPAWHETLGVAADADPATARRAMAGLAWHHHPDHGGSPVQMARVSAAYEAAQQAAARDASEDR